MLPLKHGVMHIIHNITHEPMNNVNYIRKVLQVFQISNTTFYKIPVTISHQSCHVLNGIRRTEMI